jgi:23S rRNA pseudouridine1911/1915/1917 synthase
VTRDGSLVAEVPALLDGVRVDRAIALLAGISRAEAATLVGQGHVSVGGKPIHARSRVLRAGDALVVDGVQRRTGGVEPEPEVPVRVVYVDEHIIVVDKPPGLVVHPGAGHPTDTLVGGLLARFPDLGELPSSGAGDPGRPGIVHRLDKGASGLLVVARSATAYRSLVAQLAGRRVDRRYITLVHGRLEEGRGVVEAPIGRSSRSPVRMAVTSQGRDARTRFRVITRFDVPEPSALLIVGLDTGRTHQIRVHMASIGHPVAGDDRYRRRGRTDLDRRLGAERLFLHAVRLGFEHPATGEITTWRSPLAADLREVVELEGRGFDGVDLPEP